MRQINMKITPRMKPGTDWKVSSSRYQQVNRDKVRSYHLTISGVTDDATAPKEMSYQAACAANRVLFDAYIQALDNGVTIPLQRWEP